MTRLKILGECHVFMIIIIIEHCHEKPVFGDLRPGKTGLHIDRKLACLEIFPVASIGIRFQDYSRFQDFEINCDIPV